MSCERVRRDIVECMADRRELPSEIAAHLHTCATCAAWACDVARIYELVDETTDCIELRTDVPVGAAVVHRSEALPPRRPMTPRFAVGAALCAVATGAAAFFISMYSVSVRIVPRHTRVPVHSAGAPETEQPVAVGAADSIRSTTDRGGWSHRRSVRTPGAAGSVAERTTVAAVRQRSESQPERQGVPSSDLLLKSPDPTPGTSTVAPEAAPPTVARGAAFETPPERGSDPVVPGDKLLVFGPPPAKTYTKRDSAASDAAARASGGFAAMGAARSAAQLPGAPSPGEVRISGGSDVYINPGRGEKADISVCPAENGAVSVRVFSTGGRLLWETHRDASAGSVLNIEWSGTNSGGQTLASGVYIVVVRGAGIDARRKICIVR